MRQLFTLLVIWTICSCSAEKTSTANNNDNEGELIVVDTVYTDAGNYKGDISDMVCWGDYLILLHPQSLNMFSIINIKTGELVRECCQVGRDSGESLDYSHPLTVVDSLLYYTDTQSRELCAISIPQMLRKNERITITRTKYTYSSAFRPSKVAPVKKQLVYTGCFSNGGFGVTAVDGSIINHEIDYPFDSEFTGIENGTVYQRLLSSGGNNGKCVISTLFSDQFEIIQIDSDNIKRIYNNEWTFLPVITNSHGRYCVMTSQSNCGIVDINSDDKKIAMLYFDGDYTQFCNEDYHADKIQFCNWEGKEFVRLQLPVGLQQCAIDAEYIYGVSCENEANIIYKLKVQQ